MSYSFSGDEILRDELDDDLGSERSVPLNDASSVSFSQGLAVRFRADCH